MVVEVLTSAVGLGLEVAERSFCGLVSVGASRAVLAACIPSIVQWVVCVTTSMVQDAWWLPACVFVEIRTYMCV